MTNNVYDFLGGSSSNYMAHAPANDNPVSRASKQVEQVVEKKGFFASICDSVTQWFGGTKTEAPQPKVQTPDPSIIEIDIRPLANQQVVQNSNFLQLPDDCLMEICNHLQIFEVASFASVCHTTHRVVFQRIFFQAQTWGYEGGDHSEGYVYCQEMAEELKSADLPFFYNNDTRGVIIQGVVWVSDPDISERLKQNLSTLNNLNKKMVLCLLDSGLIYESTLEKTRKLILTSTYELFPEENHEDLEWDDDTINLVLTMAVIHKEKDVASFALKMGADPNVTTSPNLKNCYQDFSSLHHAMHHNSGVDLTRLLLKNGANVNLQTSSGATPLLVLLYQKFHIESNDKTLEATTQLLLEQGADPNIPNQYGDTPLTEAMNTIGEGRRTIMLTLLKHGAQVNQPGSSNQTALHLACHKLSNKFDTKMIGNIQLIFDLTRHGANWFAVDSDGYTPLGDFFSSPPVVLTCQAGIGIVVGTVAFKIAQWRGFI